MHILGNSHGISFQVYPQTTFLIPHMYTNIHSHKHKITQLTWNHLVHSYNIYKFNIWNGWSLIHISANWWVHQQITFRHYSFYTLISLVSMALQNSFHTLGSILPIYCPTPQNSMFVIGLYKCSNEIQLVYYCFMLVRIC